MPAKVPALPPALRKPRAAQYLRMSTEHQNYSLEFQASIIGGYAAAHGWEIAQTYVDAGISGLGIKGREGLRSLLADVVSGSADFEIILVYDVSRWGRFQDPDQGAHYEFVCREAGIQVEYCAEPFRNNGAMADTLVKQVKRAMAAEYSRELSERTAQSKRQVSLQGYWQGGPAPYGLRRVLVSPDGSRRLIMEAGEHKSLQSGRTILVPGPVEEVATVRRMFQRAADGVSPADIARELNARASFSDRGRTWRSERIRTILRDKRYLAINTFSRIRRRLGTVVSFPRDDWLHAGLGFDPIVSERLFRAAAKNARTHHSPASEQEMLNDLRRLMKVHGGLTSKIINADRKCCSAVTYFKRFGSLMQAYERVGYTPTDEQRAKAEGARRKGPIRHERREPQSTEDMLRQLRALFAKHGYLTADLIDLQPQMRAANYTARFGGLRRAYALVGYEANRLQERVMDQNRSQDIDRDEARRIRQSLGHP